MNQTGEPKEDRPSAQPPQLLPLAMLGAEVGGLTLIIVFAALFGGLWLDRLLGTKPVITIILLLGSAPLALTLTYFLAMRAVKNIKSAPPSEKVQSFKEEKDSE